MKIDIAIKVLKQYNQWRRGEDNDVPMLQPFTIGTALDTVIQYYEKSKSKKAKEAGNANAS